MYYIIISPEISGVYIGHPHLRLPQYIDYLYWVSHHRFTIARI